MKRSKLILLIIAPMLLFWACETTDPLVNDVQVDLVTGNFESALETVNTALEQDSSNYVAHYYKGIVLASQAWEMEPPSTRQPVYENARTSFDSAKDLMEAQPEEPEELEQLTNSVVSFWADEYNMAVNIQNDDSLFNATENPYETSLAHLENAVTINPDSAMTYQVLSSTYYQLDQVDQAIESYENAMELLEQPAPEDYEYLVSLYLYNNNYEEAIELSEEGREVYPEETMFVQFLADAYIQAGDRDRAISLVEELIDSEPNNPQYRRVLGTQVYQSVERISNQVSDLYEELFELRQAARNQRGQELEQTQSEIESLESEIESMEQEIDELSAISIREMEQVVELVPEDEEANFILGVIYQNRAANLFERRNNTMDNEEAADYDRRAKENLEKARQYYERAAEIDPENPENWRSLFQVYTALGMEEEAEDAMEKAGMNNSSN
ncbi:tetratricopeptide repeat protein [Rhodohalobacter sulfatireducens]|uniref:Tetratricopeptide repeat protein n=1 Tax=Rhodohalobacter sulfatireducens TaxID=2911366 RepID=A0ABS9KH48_9BACT|nr:tetratricopeptide repeat protein [Rhodohalobacter sulfatireducens]MCG2590176.1 tetratricopeptide repeat protein [Rhodohalobacter sulfatireducens]